LYVDHVGRRSENRRATYIAFMQAVSILILGDLFEGDLVL